MKIVISPSYAYLKDFVNGIPFHRYECDEMLHDRRNTIEKVTAPDGLQLVIKHYKRITFANRFVYTFIRRSKPKRAYINANLLLENEIRTPEPVAYIEIFKWGIYHTGYFITHYVADELLENIHTLNEEEQEIILHDFAQFMYDLHIKRIKHSDFHAKNVFFRRENGRYIFTLIDINRVQFHQRMTKKTCIKEFRRLLKRKSSMIVAERYAELRGWNIDLFCGAILMNRGLYITGKLKRALRAAIRPFVTEKNRK